MVCARTLAKALQSDNCYSNARVTLFTSRGKLCTQMGPKNQAVPQDGKPFFDYGCQYFTATTPCFRQEVERWQTLGYLTALPEGEVGTASKQKGFTPLAGEKCFVGNGGMGPMLDNIVHDTAKEFAGNLQHIAGFPDANKSVKRITKTANGWEVGNEKGTSLGVFDFVIGAFAQHVLTDPFLLTGGQASEKMLKCLRRVESNQLIPMQVSFGNSIPATFTAAHVSDDEALGFVSNNSKKPQQNGKLGTPGPQHWTLISTALFAEREFNKNPKGYRGAAEKHLLESFARMLGVGNMWDYKPSVNRINHWEDGLPAKTPPNSRGCLFDAEAGLGWCGDFCTLPGIEGAALSGQAMATTLVDFLSKGQDFDNQHLLPADVDWEPFRMQDQALMDIGAFSSKLGMAANWTHTDLVPSAVNGYNAASGKGAGGQKIRADGGVGGKYGGGKGKAKGNGNGQTSGKSSGKGKWSQSGYW